MCQINNIIRNWWERKRFLYFIISDKKEMIKFDNLSAFSTSVSYLQIFFEKRFIIEITNISLLIIIRWYFLMGI